MNEHRTEADKFLRWREERKATRTRRPKGGRVCSVCLEWKPKEDFGSSNHTILGMRSQCRPCKNAALRARYRRSPATYRRLQRQQQQRRQKEHA